MREYETVVITKPDLPESQLKQMGERLKGLIEKHEGRLFYARNMGRRSLAYPIKKLTKGVYTCLDYASKGTVVTELERSLKLDEDVLRFLTVQKNEEIDVEARAAEIVARGEDQVQLPVEGAPAEGPAREVRGAGADKAGEEDVAADPAEEGK